MQSTKIQHVVYTQTTFCVCSQRLEAFRAPWNPHMIKGSVLRSKHPWSSQVLQMAGKCENASKQVHLQLIIHFNPRQGSPHFVQGWFVINKKLRKPNNLKN